MLNFEAFCSERSIQPEFNPTFSNVKCCVMLRQQWVNYYCTSKTGKARPTKRFPVSWPAPFSCLGTKGNQCWWVALALLLWSVRLWSYTTAEAQIVRIDASNISQVHLTIQAQFCTVSTNMLWNVELESNVRRCPTKAPWVPSSCVVFQ